MTISEVIGAVIVVGLGLVALLAGPRLLHWVVAVLPVGPTPRARLRRWLPAVQLGFGVAVLVLVAALAFGLVPALVAATATLLIMTGAAWFAIRDLVAGIVLRAEHGFEPGHTIEIADVAGRVHRVGARSVEIEGRDGHRIRVPYSRLGAAPISIARPREGGGALSFTVTLPRRGTGRDDLARIRAAALHTFFASARREPRVHLSTEDERGRSYDVTVYAADPALLPAIEQAVVESLR
ncbi:MAG TPA: mechanosensitive ion channel domain-containing protein [Longimicrobiales bacterium]|nr:mechanosensitive ion channel domain-containing protein [Longimicrobiales bacterium]